MFINRGGHMLSPNPYPGKLIVVEGIDGSGKSTQIDLLYKWLQTHGKSVYFSEWNSSELVKSTTRLGKDEKAFTHTGLSPTMAGLSIPFCFYCKLRWPLPRSLAPTKGVSVDVLSCRYWDVSLPYVRFAYLCIQYAIPLKWWVTPFGNSRVKAYSQLVWTYRSVSRPSSPPQTKASVMCPFLFAIL